MRAHVIKAPELVLTYGIDSKTREKLSAVLQGLFLPERRILPEETTQQVGYLAGYQGFQKREGEKKTAAPCDGVLCLSGLSSSRIDVLLKALREEKIEIPLKAVVTPMNQTWSFEKLIEELEKEHKEILKIQAEKKQRSN